MVRRLAALLCLWSLVPFAQAADAVVQFRHFLQDMKSFEATFEQQQFDERGDLTETASGTVAVARPGRFDWDYQQPYRQRIVSDGKQLYLYDADLAQVTVNEMQAGAPDSPARLLGEAFDLDATFDVAALAARDGLDWVRLTPKTQGQQFREIEIGLADGVLGAMRLHDNLGQLTAIRFKGLKRNATIAPSRFVFAAPPGVDVIHGMGQ